jgi:phage terminase large subunit
LRIVIPYKPRPQFLPFHERTQRWAVIVAHRRAGKTVACVNELIKAALLCDKRDGRFAYAAPLYTQAKDVAWTYLKRFTAPVPGVAYHESELRVDFPNSARVRLYGMDNYDRMRGLYLDGVILDEIADAHPRAITEVIRPILADRRGWAAYLGTPKGRNHFWEIWNQAQDNPDWFTLRLKASETGILPAEELADMRRGMTEDQYAQELECDFTAAILGAFYGREMRQAEEQGRLRDVPYDPLLPVHTSWDLGFSDDTAIWFFQIVASEVRLIDYYASHGEGVAHYCDVIHKKPYTYGTHWVPHDAVPATFAANGRSILQQLHAGGVKARVCPNLSVQDGIQAVRLMLPRCYFDKDKCAEGIEALRQYRREYDEDKKAFRDKPLRTWANHAADSLRYAALVWREEHQPPKPDNRIRTIHDATLDELWDLQKRQTGKRI